ncbi:helix-turn-helix domain-containing protein [Shimia sp. R9_2]|uniref:helix-turn-helix domain-containing protein n=1 Tax=Shimia sp. R9_2 TaxID=2821112 RepID=UPI001ADD01B8|nr:helix-turn-helix domain-containing protein [Shimia sp. R9_2]MBO9398719.1 helix-turn-helix domain-containing protein [Shimia sp. R9_2]
MQLLDSDRSAILQIQYEFGMARGPATAFWLLRERAGKPVDHVQIDDAIDAFNGAARERDIRNVIKHVRAALRKTENSPTIKTIYGGGYVLELPDEET